jgi:hypothetical protein
MKDLVLEEFFLQGTRLLHREDGPAVTLSNGTEVWYQTGLKHRVGGPAVVRKDGYQAWYQHGIRHRIDGPAIITASNDAFFYLADKRYSFSYWLSKVHLDKETELSIILQYNIKG